MVSAADLAYAEERKPRAADLRSNLILRRLSSDACEQICDSFRLVRLPQGSMIYERDARIQSVYFPQTAILSISQVMRCGTIAEVAMVGREGFAVIEAVLGGSIAASAAICQIGGYALAIAHRELQLLTKECRALRELLLEYVRSYSAMLTQLIVCNRLHRLEQRCARWLLMTADRNGTTFPMTQERLSMMLGAQRPSITAAMATLRDAGCLSGRRGQVRITGRTGLEIFACECYAICARHFQASAVEDADEGEGPSRVV